VLQQVERTLHAAAHDEHMGEAVRKGRLTRELDPTGFGVFSPADAKPPKARREGQRDARSQRDEERRAEFRRRVQELRHAVKAAERDHESRAVSKCAPARR
jgi:hypothetical protein